MVYPGVVLGAGDPKASGQIIINLITQKLPAIAFPGSVMIYVHNHDVAEAIIKALEKKNNIGEKYLVGKYRYKNEDIFKMIGEISGVPPPKLSLPDFLIMANAAILTGIAGVIRKPPLWGMSTDSVRQWKAGIEFEGTKTERELGLRYTPIPQAIKEEIDAYRQRAGASA